MKNRRKRLEDGPLLGVLKSTTLQWLLLLYISHTYDFARKAETHTLPIVI